MLLLLLEDYFEVMTSEVDLLYQRSRSTFLDFQYAILFISHPKFPSGWDPLVSIEICRSLTRFLCGVGSVWIDQDMSLPDQISLRGGISFHLNDLLFPSKRIFLCLICLFYISCQCRRSLNKVCSCLFLEATANQANHTHTPLSRKKTP